MKRDILPHILVKPVSFTARDGDVYSIHPLTEKIADQNTSALLAIHNLIPKVKWRPADLMRTHALREDRQYLDKWRLSFVVKRQDTFVGLLLAYARKPSESHPMIAIYVHRFAIHGRFQRMGIGTQLLAFAVAAFFEAAPWLLTVSIQTNDDVKNRHVLRLYERLHFRRCYRVNYPDKRDWLLEVPRAEHLPGGFSIPSDNSLRVASFDSNCISPISDPFYSRNGSASVVYFGTGSREKREQYRHLLRCYGFELQSLTHTLKLSEPQVEGVGSGPESALVTAPLKLYSRFAALENTYPVVVEDTMLFIEHFNNDYSRSPILPGADTKRWWRALGAVGVLKAMQGSRRRRATYVCQLGVALRNTRYEYLRFDLSGQIATRLRRSAAAGKHFPYTNATFFHSIFIPEGSDQTIAEMDSSTFVHFDYRRKCLEKALPHLRAAALPDPQRMLFDGLNPAG